ncbi:ADAMTS-like protein 5 isoform X2 [Patagioenas fasciata]|uniref:ADAMTS-like protein 5 isoform X2 n=1 Tax=Patagioenas fasciata TaxID=372321 RepID=UPI003A991795
MRRHPLGCTHPWDPARGPHSPGWFHGPPRWGPRGAHGCGSDAGMWGTPVPALGTMGLRGLCSHRHRWPWRLLLLAWLSLGCGVGTVQDPALGTPVQVPKHPAPARPRRQPAQGAWGPWGPWSSCSSSCGDGVTLRTRRCLRSPEEGPCTGDPRQYRLCQLQGCPPGSVPFRAMQCSLYDNKPVLGTSARYSWVPFYGAPNVCDLNCLAVGHNFYYSFGRVLDGTRCGPGSLDLCVSGRCLSVGCDGILGSGARPDACGQCGGGHDSCLFVHRLFQGAEPSSGYFGYMNVTKIPAGATHIKVTDKSRNYLALMMSDGRYVLNGDWSIAWPGPLEAAGTRLRYARAPDGTESLEAPGPTAEDLHLMVLLQEPNPGIEYEFWLPRGLPQPGRGDTSPLRQPQPRGAGSPPPPEPPVTPVPALPPQPRGFVTEPPPRNPPSQSGAGAATGRCGRCHPAKGRSQRIRHFCQSDFGPYPGAGRGGAGDALRGGGDNVLSSPLPAGVPGVRVGPQHLRVPPAPGGRPVRADGAETRQLRADAEPAPAAGRRLRAALDAPRGAAGAGGSPALPPPATLSPPPHRWTPRVNLKGLEALLSHCHGLGWPPGTPSCAWRHPRGHLAAGGWRRVLIYCVFQKINACIPSLAV